MIAIGECFTFMYIQENRERSKLDVNLQQKVYDFWIENSFTTTDAQNSRNEINISKRRFIHRYREISNKEFVEERKCKRAQTK